MYNVYGSQNEFVERVTRIFILRMRSLRQNGPLRRITVFAVARIVFSQTELYKPCFDPFVQWQNTLLII